MNAFGFGTCQGLSGNLWENIRDFELPLGHVRDFWDTSGDLWDTLRNIWDLSNGHVLDLGNILGSLGALWDTLGDFEELLVTF